MTQWQTKFYNGSISAFFLVSVSGFASTDLSDIELLQKAVGAELILVLEEWSNAMYNPRYENVKHCRWCGQTYRANKPIDKDGFHNDACKQAHYRAYKKYVTVTDRPGRRSSSCQPDIK